ncbi:MAG: type II toxin-antitoxin system HicB family antitoxin [Rhodospirillales bacterium]|nr:type II toxin-antitoxin system HicB family antitoxin [Rhodospirillales bacterium]
MIHRELIRTSEGDVTAEFEPAEEGGYIVRFPAIAHLATEGGSLDDARAMAADCLQGYIETLRELGRPLPQHEPHRLSTG